MLIMLTLDLMHRAIKSRVDEKDYESMGYTNFERLYLILLWPLVMVGVILAAINGKRPE